MNKFSHIYVEKDILDNENTKSIISYFHNAKVILINDYRDIFNRKKQNIILQKERQNLILAKKKKDFIYKASPVCQSFNNDYFYYSSCIMNCIYDCQYCFLKGMYPSSNIVLFVNIDDFFNEVKKQLLIHPLYLCISYDSDLLALEPICHYGQKWANFTMDNKDLTIEIRTKGTANNLWQNLPVNERIILAFTLSPQYVITNYEHLTLSLKERIRMINKALSLGYTCRLCFDPILIFNNWQQHYIDMLNLVKLEIDLSKIKDISIGSFRISSNYLNNMRQFYPDSAVLQYPYICKDGFYQLPDNIKEKAENLIIDNLIDKISIEKIFRWE